MFDRRRGRILLAVLTLVSLVLLTVDSRAGRTGPLAQVRDGVATIFGPVQDGVATVVRPVGGFFEGVGELFDLREENARLRARLEELEQRRRSFEDLVRENSNLRRLLDTRGTLRARDDAYELLAAEVIALSPSNFEWTITIDVGSDHGVATDMTVMNGDGLVGRVVQVGPTVSRVLLAIDPNFAAAARVARTGENGVVEGADTDPLRLSLFDAEGEVETGDEVVTSAYENGTFPDGIPVGVAEVVAEPTSGEAREVTVRPYVAFTRLDAVLVVLRRPPPTDLPTPARRPASPTPTVPSTEEAGT